MIFKEEIYVSHSVQDANRIADLLTSAQIKCWVRSMDLTDGGALEHRRASGTMGMNMQYSMLYYVYVAKKNYKKAKEILA